MEYPDDLQGNFKKMYGEKEQKLTTGSYAQGRRLAFNLLPLFFVNNSAGLF